MRGRTGSTQGVIPRRRSASRDLPLGAPTHALALRLPVRSLAVCAARDDRTFVERAHLEVAPGSTRLTIAEHYPWIPLPDSQRTAGTGEIELSLTDGTAFGQRLYRVELFNP